MKRLKLPDSWRGRAIVVSEVDAGDEWFTESELLELGNFRLQKRRDEWKRSRVAAKQLAVDRGIASSADEVSVLTESGALSAAPILWHRGAPAVLHVSLSHSAQYAAAAIDSAPVGIDVQVRRDISEAAAHLFLREDEIAMMRSCTIADAMIHFWCAKEAAWKQRRGNPDTLRKVAVEMKEETARGLLFDSVETLRVDDLVVALTLPTS